MVQPGRFRDSGSRQVGRCGPVKALSKIGILLGELNSANFSIRRGRDLFYGVLRVGPLRPVAFS